MSQPPKGNYRLKQDAFCYSPDELKRILDCLGEPQWSEAADDWHKKSEMPTKEDIQKDPLAQIAEMIEPAAKHCLTQAIETRNELDNELENVQKIAELAGELGHILLSKNSYQKTYANAFMFDEELGFDEETKLLSLIWDLERLEALAPEVSQHFEQAFGLEWKSKRNAAAYDFVSSLMYIWEEWTQSEPGGSKAGGPSARFVVEAFRPVEAFAMSELDVSLRKWSNTPVCEESAGTLILNMKKEQREN